MRILKRIVYGAGRDEDRERRYAYFSSTIPSVNNQRQLTDRERDAIRMSNLEVELEEAVGNQELTEKILKEMRELDRMLSRPNLFYGDDGNYLSDSDEEDILDRLNLDDYNFENIDKYEDDDDDDNEDINALTKSLDLMRTGRGISFKKRMLL